MTVSEAAIKVGLFHVTYISEGTMPGGVSLKLDLLVSTPNSQINGLLHASQATNPPLDLNSKVSGRYAHLPMPPHPLIVATLKGYPVMSWPPHGGIGPVLQENAEIHLMMAEDWQSGTASLSYVDSSGHWHHVSGIKLVKAVSATI